MHLQADVLASTEGTTYPAKGEPHLLDRQIETRCDLCTVFVEPLRGDEQLDTTATRVGQGQRGFQTQEGLVLHARFVDALDDDLTHQRLVSGDDPLMADHVACRMDRWMAAVDRPFGVRQHRKHLVLDDDRRQCPAAGLGMIGGDRRDRLTDVAHDIAGEDRLITADQSVRRLTGYVIGGDDHRDAVDLPRRRDIDAHDSGVCVR